MAWKLFRLLRHTSFEALPALPQGTPCFITDEGKACIRTATRWERLLSSVHGITAMIAATPDAPVLRDSAGRSQIASPVALDDIANRRYVDQQIAALAMPVGVTYIQFPGMAEPGVIWAGTWQNVSSTFAGAFFRAEGGSALSFGGGAQAGQNASHGHTASSDPEATAHTHAISFQSGLMNQNAIHNHRVASMNAQDTWTAGFGLYKSRGITGTTDPTPVDGYYNVDGAGVQLIENANINHSHPIAGNTGDRSAPHTHLITVAAAGGDEPRPINFTIRIWRRMS